MPIRSTGRSACTTTHRTAACPAAPRPRPRRAPAPLPAAVAAVRVAARVVRAGSKVAAKEFATTATGPAGRLPLSPDLLRNAPSGDLFGWTQNAGMGWDPATLGRPELLILSTQGGLRAADGSPIALGFHSGHWEVGLQ